jgi:hypothetical protein
MREIFSELLMHVLNWLVVLVIMVKIRQGAECRFLLVDIIW